MAFLGVFRIDAEPFDLNAAAFDIGGDVGGNFIRLFVLVIGSERDDHGLA
jgi:hypothetical protein